MAIAGNRTAFDRLSSAVLLLSPEGRVLDMNSRASELLQQSVARVAGIFCWLIEWPGQTRTWATHLNNTIQHVITDHSIQEIQLDVPIISGGPAMRHYMLRISPLVSRPHEERLSGLLVEGIDATVMAEGLREKRALSERLTAMMNAAFMPMALVDSKGRIMQVNSDLLTRCSENESEVQGKLLWQLSFFAANSGIQQKLEKAIGNTLKGTTSHFEMDIVGEWGEEVFLEVYIHALTENLGDETCVVFSARDLTTARRAEIQARASEQRLNLAIEALGIGFAIWDEHGKLAVLNNRYRDFFDKGSRFLVRGAPRQEVRRLLDRLGELPEVAHLQLLAVEQREDELHGENYECQLGSGAWVQVREFRTESGEWVELISDISEFKKLQVDMIKAKEAAVASNEAKSRFLATMSHEIRTPMSGILGLVEMLGMSPLDTSQKRSVELIRQSGQQLSLIIDDILDFSKIEANMLRLEYEPLNVEAIIESVMGSLTANASMKSLQFEAYVDPAMPRSFVGDEVRLRQILFNLLGNAIKFSAVDGRVGVRAMLAAGEGDADGQVCIMVQDTGIGMSEESLERLFCPFEQSDVSTTRRYGGTGLGLSITHELVALMAGHIDVASEEGVGSCFTVHLPLSRADESAAPLSTPDALLDLHGIHVLIVASGLLVESLPNYLAHAGAVVDGCFESTADSDARKQPSVDATPTEELPVLVCGPQLGLQRLKQLQARGHLHGKRFGAVVHLAADLSEEYILHASERRVALRSNPIQRKSLLACVALVTGRISEQSLMVPVQQITSDATPQLLSVEQAEEAGSLVLLAEDNPTTREVLSRQLALLGVTAEFACDGADALAMLQKREYGMLLTDCHMPIMDGYALTRAIRQMEVAGSRRLPIVAVSAAAMAEEEQRGMECGMDDYLSKPIELKRLQLLLRRWLPETGGECSGGRAGPVAVSGEKEVTSDQDAVSQSAPTYDEATIDLAVLIGYVGDDEAVQRGMLVRFVRNNEEMRDQIRHASTEHNLEEVGGLAHRMKSSARYFGAGALADCSERLETACRKADQDEVAILVQQVDERIGEIHSFVLNMAG